MLKAIPKDYHDPSKGTLKLLWEEEWRALGITQVRGAAFKHWEILADHLPLRVSAGSIMKYTSQNPTYFSSSKFS